MLVETVSARAVLFQGLADHTLTIGQLEAGKDNFKRGRIYIS